MKIKENKEELSSETDPEKAENEEYRNFKEEPGDDDGENRNPEKRHSLLLTGLFVTKAMIGTGLLNIPLHFRNFGIINGLIASVFLNSVTISSTYFLLRCKDITQRYSYAVYSKLTMGLVGTLSVKFAIIIRSFSLCCVLLKLLGKIIRTIFLIFFNEYRDKFFLNSEFLIVIFSVLITPLMLQKDISGIAKFTFLGIYAILLLFISLVILLIFKINKNEIKPFEKQMLYSSGDFFRNFKSLGSYLNAYLFQVNCFPLYLPLHPRSSKNMLKATFLGTILCSIIYISFGIIGFIIYRYDINDTLLIYLGDDLIKYIKTNKLMATLLIIFEIAFIANTTISTMINFFIGKSGLINFIKFILKNRNKNKNNKDIPLVDLDQKGDLIKKNNLKVKETVLSERFKTFITLFAYMIVVFVCYASETIISIDNFNGSTVNNFVSIMLPALFFIIISRDQKISFERILAIFVLLFSFCLISGYLLFNFTNIYT